MRVDVFLTPTEVDAPAVADRTVVVIDVIRATSTMVEALANGARAIYPTVSTEDAIKLLSSLGREDTLLCGERKGLKVDGFDLGNSPSEFTPERVADKRLVMSTTNGTRAFMAASGADRVVAASFLNLGAVVETLASVEDLVVICAGKEDAFSLDDAVCAGVLVGSLAERSGRRPACNDGARAAAVLAGRFSPDAAFLRETAAGRALVEVGLGEDLDFVAQRDRHRLVPEMQDRMIRAAPPSA